MELKKYAPRKSWHLSMIPNFRRFHFVENSQRPRPKGAVLPKLLCKKPLVVGSPNFRQREGNLRRSEQ